MWLCKRIESGEGGRKKILKSGQGVEVFEVIIKVSFSFFITVFPPTTKNGTMIIAFVVILLEERY